MRTRGFTAVCIALSVAACGPSVQEQLNFRITEKVKESLKDPDSARVTVKQVFPLFDGRMACGHVNAKNSFGGYAGNQAFEVGINPDGSLGEPTIATGDRESAMVLAMCDFQRQYAEAPGNAGKKATPEQAKQLKDAYTKRAFEVASKLPPP